MSAPRRLVLLWALLALPAWGGEARPNAEDPQIEARLMRLAEDLRCLVCQNESLAGSRAELAEDLRREIREQMRQGKSDAEVIQYLTDRYGDFVLYRPPVKPVTYLLWAGPALFLGIGVGVWYLTLRRRRRLQATQSVSADELAQAARLLESEDK
ncbi:MAG: cytochrome c-type biogenesis protein CcmH [Thiobacillaceae bacterium]|nr:cytochrome c-type biogenesis protein CcmH [Thiobacillaceae bacterium]MCX7672681.1 cytochrome c-type biogenesis protein CcmH [Thiobacillaceae bacterium]MDW8323710.1 cytochrome c-type biogenesis protein [Burkholderiales bacterium]